MTAASHSMKFDLALFAGLTISALALELTIPHTQIGYELEYASHRWFQSGLAPSDVPVVLVDISDLKPGPRGTPRPVLEDLLRAIAKQKPKAIGLDIDFSPEELGSVDPLDPQFFNLCLSLKEGLSVPIFLGVGRTVGVKSSAWFGAPGYQELAAAVLIPEDTRKLVYSFRVKDEPTELRSLSAALAHAHGMTATGQLANWLAALHLIERRSSRDVENLVVVEFPANYSSIGSLLTFRTTSKDFIGDPAMKPFIKDKVVIVGAVAEASDKFNIAGKPDTYPGALLHASGAITLISNPLYEVTHFGRIVLTILLMIATFIPVFGVRAWARKQEPALVEHMHGTLIVVYTIGLAIAFGFFMRSTQVVWSGFFLAFLALALHRPVEDVVTWILKSRARTRNAAAVLLFIVCGTTASAEEKVGVVIEFRGPVSYQRVGKKLTKLPSRRDAVDEIFEGDRLKCDPGGSANLLIGETTQQLTSSSGWFTVPELRKPISPKVRAAIDRAFRIGAVPKSVVLPKSFRLLAPVDTSKVVLRTLILRWNPVAEGCPITASVEDVHGNRIWRESDIPSLAGRLDSNALRSALRTAEGPFALQLADTCKNAATVTFGVLASEDASLLRSDLEAWDKEVADPLVRHLGRAAMYSQHDLFFEVADEYEAALAIAPHSVALLARTIEAHDHTGNIQRRNELAARLPADH